MKRQNREVYGYGASLRTSRRLPSARWMLVIIIAATITGWLASSSP